MRDFFTNNRESLIAKIKGGVAVFSANTKMQKGVDDSYQFEQESNFWWLTGIEYADWWVIIDGNRNKTWLVSPEKSAITEIFDGSLTAGKAIEISGADAVIKEDEALRMIRDLAKKHSVVYSLGKHPYVEYFDFFLNPAPKKIYDQLTRMFSTVRDCRREISELRAIKQPQEIELIKKAIDITIDAFKHIKDRISSMNYEYEIEAEFSYYFRKKGAKGHAFDPIVASGKNACTLHYMSNNSKIRKRDLVLMDIGTRYGGYVSDITRTYSVGGISKRQIEVHNAVKMANNEIINLIKPNLFMEQYVRESDRIMKKALMSIGLMRNENDTKAFKRYYPHAISHGIGIDAHDSLGSPRAFLPNMIITVEPGIYIPEEGIGVRIEDDILVTATGSKNLSDGLSTDY